MDCDVEWEDRHDEWFGNMATGKSFDIIVGDVPKSGKPFSIKWVVRVDARMTAVIEDLHRRLHGVKRGGREPYMLRAR